jgi:DNA-binding GntR family transcriptional regulator
VIAPSIPRVKRASLAGQVYGRLRRLITYHELEPGQKLGLVEVADKLDVSLTPLREALSKLEREGFVVHQPNRGYFVAEITADEARELFEAREAIETYAVTVGIPGASEADLEALGQAIDSYGRAVDKPERDRFLEDKRLHLRLVALAGNQLLVRMLEQVFDRIIMKLRISELPRERGPAAHKEHQAIWAAVRKRDPEKATRLLRVHLAASKGYILAFLTRPGGLRPRERA